jgi:hypothetical protein
MTDKIKKWISIDKDLLVRAMQNNPYGSNFSRLIKDLLVQFLYKKYTIENIGQEVKNDRRFRALPNHRKCQGLALEVIEGTPDEKESKRLKERC